MSRFIKVGLAAAFCCLTIMCAVLFIGCNSSENNREWMEAEYPRKYSEYVEKYAKEYHVEEPFIYAIIKAETNFDPYDTSHVGAIGLMQLMPSTIDWAMMRNGITEYDVEDFYDPDKSIHYGTYTLKFIETMFVNKATQAAAYNAGWGNVEAWLKDSRYSDDGITLKDIPFPETKYYVEKVMSFYNTYKQLYYQ